MVLPPGTTLRSRYVVTRRIGAGTYGNVYEATDVVDGVAVAIKLIAAAGRHKASAVQELRLLRAVSSSYVVRLLDAFLLPERDEVAAPCYATRRRSLTTRAASASSAT